MQDGTECDGGCFVSYCKSINSYFIMSLYRYHITQVPVRAYVEGSCTSTYRPPARAAEALQGKNYDSVGYRTRIEFDTISTNKKNNRYDVEILDIVYIEAVVCINNMEI